MSLLLGVVAAVGAGAVVSAAPARAATLDLHADAGPLVAAVAPVSGALTPRLTTLTRVAKASGAAQAAAVGRAARGPGSLRRDAAGRVLVDVLVDDAAGFVAAAAAGLQAVARDDATATVTGWIAPAALGALGGAAHVRSASEVLTPMTATDPTDPTDPSEPAGAASGAAAAAAAATAAACRPVKDEANTQLLATRARTTYGVDGTGVTVGVLSDSYDRNASDTRSAAQDVASGDLPGANNPCGRTTPVDVVDDTAPSGADEGRAMLQHVHDLAPGASLAFATAFNGLTAFASNITALVDAGARVISDDVTYFNEPFFQPGPVDAAVTAAAARGVSYFSSAANNNIRAGGRDVGSYEAPAFRPVTCGTGVSCHDFDAGAATDLSQGYLVPAGRAIALDFQWAEPWSGVTDDFDIQLQDANGTVLGRSGNRNLTTQQPFEYVRWANTRGVDTAVFAFLIRVQGTGTPRVKVVALGNGAAVSDVEYRTPTGSDIVGPQIFGHNGGPDTVSLAAVPYDDATTPEVFSSPGPVTHYFAPVRGTRPAATLARARKLVRPDVAATDGAATTFFAQLDGAVWRFYGTSAASPHAAAVAALMRDADPALTPAQTRAALRANATRIRNGTAARNGTGLVNALATLAAVVGP